MWQREVASERDTRDDWHTVEPRAVPRGSVAWLGDVTLALTAVTEPQQAPVSYAISLSSHSRA